MIPSPMPPDSQRRHYDLATEKADYPPWDGKPFKTILVCSHMRSGSTLLGEALYSTRRFGCPLEYFHPGFEPHLVRRWKTNTLTEYVQHVYRHRTDSTGTLGVKLFWTDVEELFVRLHPELDADWRNRLASNAQSPDFQSIGSMIRELFPNPVFIYLKRKDRLRQSISCWRAARERKWRSIPGVDDPTPSGPPVYDYEGILNLVRFGDYSHRQWENFFLQNQIDPLRLTYEELSADFQGKVAKVFHRLDASDFPPQPPRMRRQRDEVSEQFLLRFLKDHRMQSDTAPQA
jgi:LPS sulfotransferase NodH